MDASTVRQPVPAGPGTSDPGSVDVLTGLRTRSEFERLLMSAPPERFAILAIDLDAFASLNEEHGRPAGDAVLRSTAATLALVLRSWDVVARVDGDEFAVLLPGAGAAEAAAVADRVRTAALGMPLGMVSVSVGWSAAERADLRLLWAEADRHLSRARWLGGNQVAGGVLGAANGTTPGPLPPRSTHPTARPGVLFEPIVRLGDGGVTGYEALADPAADLPTRGGRRHAPTSPAAGEPDWAWRRLALVEHRRLPESAVLFLDVSPVALLDPVHGVDQLRILLRSAGLRPERLVLELSVQAPATDPRRLQAVLGAYRRERIRFALAGVGAGSSALELLAAAAPEFLKLAPRLTETAALATSRATVAAVVAFARSTGSSVIAEGVDSRSLATQMLRMGVPLGEGRGLSAPIRAGGPPAADDLRDARRSPPGLQRPGPPADRRDG